MYRIITEKGKRKHYWVGQMKLSVNGLWAIEFIGKKEAKKKAKQLGEKFKVEEIHE
jgi:hypothetical protein